MGHIEALPMQTSTFNKIHNEEQVDILATI